jgi:hypothetical protein
MAYGRKCEHAHSMQTWKKTCQPIQLKSTMNTIVWKQVCVLEVMLVLCDDGVLCVIRY